jgi:hypothetical protein
MNIESIMPGLTKRQLEAVAIHAEINNFFGKAIVGYSTVIRCLRERNSADSSEALSEEPETQKSEPIDNAVLRTLGE